MTDRDKEEARASEWLAAREYTCERPIWLQEKPGQKNPDYWAVAATRDPPEAWIEVKSIDESDSTAALSKFWKIVDDAEIPPGLFGHAMLEIEPHAQEQSVRWALRKFALEAPRYVGRKAMLAFVQQTATGDRIQRLEIETPEPKTVWIKGDGTLPVCGPPGVCENEHSGAPTKFIDATNAERRGRAFDFIEWTRPYECSLILHLSSSNGALGKIAMMSGGDPKTFERTLRNLEDANKQIKAACLTRAAPGIVMLLPRDRFASITMVQAACYGRLGIPFSRSESGETVWGDQQHTTDGAFRPDKNRHISAAIDVREDGSATFFPNPYAYHPLTEAAGIFAGAKRADVEFTGPRQ